MEVARESGAENVSVKTSGKMIGFGVSESDLIHFTVSSGDRTWQSERASEQTVGTNFISCSFGRLK